MKVTLGAAGRRNAGNIGVWFLKWVLPKMKAAKPGQSTETENSNCRLGSWLGSGESRVSDNLLSGFHV